MMTINSNSMAASQIYANRDVQARSGASGYASQGVSDFGAMAQQLISLMDTNQSGSLDKGEFSQAAQSLAKNVGTLGNNAIDAAFGRMDGNNDGQISSDEFMNALKQATAEKQQKHHRYSQRTETDISPFVQPAQPDSAAAASPSNEMQKSLLHKIMAAYGTTAVTTGSMTNISV